MNKRNKEFAEEVGNLLLEIRGFAESEAYKTKVSPYEVEIEVDWILKWHMTQRMIATDMCARRHYDNLKNRDLFVCCGTYDCEKIKLNPKWADKEVDLIINRIKMPKNQVIGE